MVSSTIDSSTQEKTMAQYEFPLMDVEDYLELDQNSKHILYEYLDGELRMQAGGRYNSDAHLQLSETRYVHPDITVSCDSRDRGKGRILRYPHLVVEVLSPSTETTDRIKKLAYYQEHPTIQEYTMVDSQKLQIEIYHRQGEDWVLHIFRPGSEVKLESLSIHFPIEDVYEGTSLVYDEP
ncbi:MAG: Uma2 family endonuclease [Chloroflexota bacterium]|nr:MAG: Uma2 family endonuclease [Chloroflexota bacterium]